MKRLFQNGKKFISIVGCLLLLIGLIAISSGCGGTSSSNGTTAATPTPSAATISYGGTSGLQIPNTSNVPQPTGTAGNLEVLDWAGFKGAVSYTFDDGNSSQISNYSTLNDLGVHFTFYLVTGWSNASNSIWKQAVTDGHELGNHTKSHAYCSNLSDPGADIDSATSTIYSNFEVTTYTFAAPYGDTSYASYAETRFLLNRGTSTDSIAANDISDQFNLPCYIPAKGAAASTMTSVVSSARSAGKWQIFCIHGFTGDTSAYNPIDLDEFTSHVNAVKALGDVWMDSAVNVGAYWRAQKLISELSSTTSGTDIVYSWTLPDNFPPNKYLRVTVTGGTLKQNGETLTWDSHGYYEVALDAGSLTISQ